MNESQAIDRRFHEALCLAAGGAHDRAGAEFLACVVAEPGRGEFVREFLASAERLAASGQANWQLPPEDGAEQAFQRAVAESKWPDALRHGPRLLADEPQRVPVLLGMADACEALGNGETEAVYLRTALRAAASDDKCLRRVALALAQLKLFGEAIDCWRRVEALVPGDDEPPRMIVALLIANSRRRAGLRGAEDASSRPTDAANKRQREPVTRFVIGNLEALTTSSAQPPGLALNPIQQLEAAIRERPSIAELYLRLAQRYLDKDREYDAERLLAKGREATDRDARVQQMWEDVAILRDERRVAIADQEVQAVDNPQTRAALDHAVKERDRVEMEIFLARCKRQPDSAENQFQLGLRLKRAGKLREACQHFERAMADNEQRGPAAMQLGECLELLGEAPQALAQFRAAVEAATRADQFEERRDALYRAGKLAMRIKLARLGERYLSELLRIDPNYRDAAVLVPGA